MNHVLKGNFKKQTISLEQLSQYLDSTIEGNQVRENGKVVEGRTWLLRSLSRDHWVSLMDVILEGSGKWRDDIQLGQIADKKGTPRLIIINGAHRTSAMQALANLLKPKTDREQQASEDLTEDQKKRITAFIKAVPVEIAQYPNVGEALADQLAANDSGERPVAAKDRDERIKVLREEGLTLKRIGELVGLTEGSVSRIVSGEQNVTGKYRGGRTKGSRNNSGILAYKAFFKALGQIQTTLNSAEGRKELAKGAKDGDEFKALSVTAKVLRENEPILLKKYNAMNAEDEAEEMEAKEKVA